MVNVDSKLPNLALMQISAYHKSKGDILPVMIYLILMIFIKRV